MSHKSAQKYFIIAIITLLASLLLAPLTLAAQNEMRSIQAPQAPPHVVLFQTAGLPAGISITIDGSKTNPGGHTPFPFSTTFTSPGPSTNVTTEPGTEVIYSFPPTVDVGGVVYSLVVSVDPPNPNPASGFTTGASGETTTVLAIYYDSTTCQRATITTDPASQSVTYGSPVSFSVTASGTTPLSYQWYKDLTTPVGTNSESYSILSAVLTDAGTYHVVVRNTCGSDASTAATLTVNKANPTCSVTGYSVTYDGDPHTATGSCTGVHAESLSGLDLSGTTHTNAGSYTDNWSFTDVSGNYNNTSGTVGDSIAKANPACSVTGYSVTYDGNPHTAAGSCTGAKSETLSGLDLTGTTHTNAGSYTDSWSFTDITNNYNNMGGAVSDSIAKANQTITFVQPASPVPFQGTFVVNPTASSGLTVSVVVTGVCSLSGSTVTMVMPFGSCTLTASQSGNSNYNPTADVVRIVDAPFPFGLFMPEIDRP